MDDVPFAADVELIDQVIPDSKAAFLSDELSCAVLEELYPNLDFFARKSSNHIDPIHKHLQKGRKIVPTEDPNLHLVWNYNAVYIKPLPHYLLSYSFWKQNLAIGSKHRGKALGFMHSYECLIRHPSDFELAKEAHLIPSSLAPSPPSSHSGLQQQKIPTGDVMYSNFSAFIRSFSKPSAGRQKGFLNRLFYEEQFWQIRHFMNEFAAPLLFVFAALSLILSAMQVVLAAKSDNEGRWRVFTEVSAWFAVMVIVVVVAIFVGLALVGFSVWLWQFKFGYRSWRKSRADSKEAKIGNCRGG
ncbi:hypothetical protein CI238_01813 [Colletotrichum incanum]|uniref:Subtilisin-like serine protease n=1 Tax=Colletotrichum incanum TaxID=1573173 RepID=A0A167B230_COLIC|nr:hypothetical protein CI238_01813 [Colletotrichum incanum]